MPQPDLVLLLDWVREKANSNTRTANADTHAAALSSPTHGDAHAATLSSTAHGDDDSYLDAHLSGYEHGHNAALAEQLTDNIPAPNASPGRVLARPEAGVCLVVVKVAM